MKNLKPLAAAIALLLTAPSFADLGTLRGDSRKETLEKPQSVVSFARSWGLAAEQVAWANGLTPEAETGLKVTLPGRILPSNPPKDGAVVNLAERGVYLFRAGEYKGFFPLAIGRGDKVAYRTPVGTYKIVDRVKNPTWIAPDSPWAKAMDKEKIKGGHDDNPLGAYWFGFDHPKGGYGFHENVAPKTTGDKASHGCMRLYPEHAKRIYDEKLLQPGDSVRIEDRPVLLGKGKDGEMFVAVFPSAYGKPDLKAKLSKELQAEKMGGLISDERIAGLVGKPNGVPQSLLGKPVGLKVSGKEAEAETPGFRRDGRVMVPVAVARELGCKVAYDGKSGMITVEKDGKTQAFRLAAEGEQPRAYRMGDQTMVSARDLFSGLNIPFSWDGKERELEIGG